MIIFARIQSSWGTYINIGNSSFARARKANNIDKSELIAVINNTIGTKSRFSCVSRSRRFDKSMADMLCAYYEKFCDTREIFFDLEISHYLHLKSISTNILLYS